MVKICPRCSRLMVSKILNECICYHREESIMPDITMCDGKGCVDKKKCYRFMAEPNPLCDNQSYFSAPDVKECEYFMELWKESK